MSGPAPHRVWYLSGVGLTQLDSAEPLALGTAPSMLGEPPARSSPMSENHSTSGFAPHRCRHSDGLRTTQVSTVGVELGFERGTCFSRFASRVRLWPDYTVQQSFATFDLGRGLSLSSIGYGCILYRFTLKVGLRAFEWNATPIFLPGEALLQVELGRGLRLGFIGFGCLLDRLISRPSLDLPVSNESSVPHLSPGAQFNTSNGFLFNLIIVTPLKFECPRSNRGSGLTSNNPSFEFERAIGLALKLKLQASIRVNFTQISTLQVVRSKDSPFHSPIHIVDTSVVEPLHIRTSPSPPDTPPQRIRILIRMPRSVSAFEPGLTPVPNRSIRADPARADLNSGCAPRRPNHSEAQHGIHICAGLGTRARCRASARDSGRAAAASCERERVAHVLGTRRKRLGRFAHGTSGELRGRSAADRLESELWTGLTHGLPSGSRLRTRKAFRANYAGRLRAFETWPAHRVRPALLRPRTGPPSQSEPRAAPPRAPVLHSRSDPPLPFERPDTPYTTQHPAREPPASAPAPGVPRATRSSGACESHAFGRRIAARDSTALDGCARGTG
ncbi:hypothetical protein B0H15DRAFT_963640 [Mycena belliarum]|uniref:Uncharacterized protein n=1 Tax=Mycena belliarum TaxID=1033014 RepID=A0AAD6TPR9_9AGAR|nr:hypothetical protein B0H15DRAFT_963640 [Mycena belliae]